MVNNLSSNAGDEGSIPGQGTKIPHAWKQLSLCVATIAPAGYNSREVHELPLEKPAGCNEDPVQPEK